MLPPTSHDTIAAIATAHGVGAIGIVRLSGPDAIAIAARVVEVNSYPNLSKIPSHACVLGAAQDQGLTIDQVLITVFRSPHSYTGEDVAEISCHGGTVVLKKILELFLRQGARPAQRGEFSERAFLNGKMDLSQAEAVADLINAQTETARAAAMNQLQGGLSKKIAALRQNCIEALAHLEVGLDHSDDTSVGPTMQSQRMQTIFSEGVAELQRLIHSYEFGRKIQQGVKIAIVGKPNAGKSSLLNCLLKHERAIVTHLPGTTRDTLEEAFDLLGVPAILMDTAGIRQHAADVAEQIGIERTRASIQKADGICVVFDGSAALSDEDQAVAKAVGAHPKVLLVLNKSDLPGKIEERELRTLFPSAQTVLVSALQESGIENFLNGLYGLVCERLPAARQAEQAEIVTSLRHQQCLLEASESLTRALALCGKADMDECLALEIQNALDALGQIIGETLSDDILSEIFAKFCIGK